MDTTRRLLVPLDKNNVVTRRPRATTDLSSRNRSPTPTKTVHRCPSPSFTRPTLSSISQSVATKRTVSAERKRPSTPPSPSTPIDSSRRLSTLWPSTMRSLNVSFQSDSVSAPKKEKPISVDRTSRPSLDVAQKQKDETRKRSPLKGKNLSENFKPLGSSQSRLIEQHRWPSRISGKINPKSLNRSLDLGDKPPSVRRISLPLSTSSKPFHKTSSITLVSPTKSEDHNISRRLLAASSLDRATLATAVARLHPLSRPASPSKTSVSRGVSPLRGLSPSRVTTSSSFARPSTPPSRGVSPSRVRQTATSTQSSTENSVLSFFSDVKKGKKANYIEDVHQLRLLYNRYLQWRFVIARADAVMYIQQLISEETLFNVWQAISELQDDVTSQRIVLQQLKLEIKLNSLLNNQIASLEEWAILERNHVSSLVGIITDLEANTLRLPTTEGTKADIESLKAAMSSALDVMQAMGSSIWSLVSKVVEMSKMVSELAFVVAKESSMQEKCEDLLASTAVIQIKECSLKTHLIQTMREDEDDDEEESLPPLVTLSKFPWP